MNGKKKLTNSSCRKTIISSTDGVDTRNTPGWRAFSGISRFICRISLSEYRAHYRLIPSIDVFSCKQCRRLKICILFLVLSNCCCLACDDTLLALLTFEDPQSVFSVGIRNFNRDLSALGTALKAKQIDQYDPLMQKVMDSWLEFSNKFAVNPPDIARNDKDWASKIRDTGERIGIIRKLIASKEFTQAHDNVLTLSGKLTSFFSAIGMSVLKKSFLQASELFINMEQELSTQETIKIQTSLASFSIILESLSTKLNDSSKRVWERIKTSTADFKILLSKNPPEFSKSALKILTTIKSDFTELRSHILMNEWFPSIPDSPASSTGGQQ